MDRFVHNENIALYRRLISESELAASRDEDRHKMLLTLLAEEIAKDASAADARTGSTGRFRNELSGR